MKRTRAPEVLARAARRLYAAERASQLDLFP
jgi:hypothetical protein